MTSPMNLNHEHEESYGSGGSGISHAPSDGNEYVSKNAAWAIASAGGGSGLFSDVVILSDIKSNGTSGGTATTQSWTNRILNTEDVDSGSICTLSSNQFTLPAGNYVAYMTAPFYRTDGVKLRLRNITDSSTEIAGGNNQISNGTGNPGGVATLMGYFTLAATKTLALQYFVYASGSSSSLGVTFATESAEQNSFAQIILLKLA